jgi:hypothetical protein
MNNGVGPGQSLPKRKRKKKIKTNKQKTTCSKLQAKLLVLSDFRWKFNFLAKHSLNLLANPLKSSLTGFPWLKFLATSITMKKYYNK